MRKVRGGRRFLTMLLLVVMVVSLGAGCARFDASKPLQEAVDDQFTNFPRSTGAFLKWCVDETTGDPASLGP